MSARSLPAGWTRSLVEWQRAEEPARFETDMEAMRSLVDRAFGVNAFGCCPFPGLPAPMDPVTRQLFAILGGQARIASAHLAGDLEDFRQLEVSIAASGPSAAEQGALVAARVFGAL